MENQLNLVAPERRIMLSLKIIFRTCMTWECITKFKKQEFISIISSSQLSVNPRKRLEDNQNVNQFQVMRVWVIISSLIYLPNQVYHLCNWEVVGEERSPPPQPYRNTMADTFNCKKQRCWKSAQNLSVGFCSLRVV